MAALTLHIVPDDSFDDWVVRDASGHELGHYPTREAAQLSAEAVARKRGGELIVHLPDGRTSHMSFKKGGSPDCSGDDGAGSLGTQSPLRRTLSRIPRTRSNGKKPQKSEVVCTRVCT